MEPGPALKALRAGERSSAARVPSCAQPPAARDVVGAGSLLRGGPVLPSASQLLALQRAAGNHAVAGTLASRALARQATAWTKYSALAPREIERLYNKAVTAQDWKLLLGVVNSFADDKDAVRLLRPIQKQGAGALTLAAILAEYGFHWDADHPLRRALAFLRVEDQTGRQARTPRNAGWNLGTPNGSSVTVPGGSVTVYDEVMDPRGGRTDYFALQYKGRDADATGWLQFVALEAEAFDAGTGGKGDFESGTMTGAGQPETLKYGTPGSSDWHLDARSESLPFYESANSRGAGSAIIEYPASATAAGQTTMIDRPQQDQAIVKKAWGSRTRRVERRVRCHQYLVRGEDVLFENDIVVQDTYWNLHDVPVRKNIVGNRAMVDKLQPAHHEALIRRRPEFGYFAH